MSQFRMRAISEKEAKEAASKYELPAAATYKAVLAGIYDVGTQEGQFKPKHQVVLNFRLYKGNRPLCDSQGNPHAISGFYTLSLNEKANLREVVESLVGPINNGDEFELGDILGKACRVRVEHYTKLNGKAGAKIKSVIGLDDDEVAPKLDCAPVLFEISGTRCLFPEGVPSWIAEIAKKSPEWQGTTPPSPASPPADDVRLDEDADDDIPF